VRRPPFVLRNCRDVELALALLDKAHRIGLPILEPARCARLIADAGEPRLDAAELEVVLELAQLVMFEHVRACLEDSDVSLDARTERT
jgi:hypothetical protein